MRRVWLPVVLGLLFALVLLFALRWGSARPVAALEGAVVATPLGEGDAPAWIERRGDGDYLLTGGGRGAPRVLFSGPALGGLALSGGRIITTGAEQTGPVQLRIAGEDGRVTSLAALSAPARSLSADATWICGVSVAEPALPSAPFVVAGGASTVIWAVAKGADRAVPVSQAMGGGGEAPELLGVAGDQVYWVSRRRQSGNEVTAISRCRLPDGPTEVLVSESGGQSAVLAGDRLAWTCPSPEAAGQLVGVKVQPLAGGEARVVADWLARGTTLLSAGGRLYAQERDALWQLGEARGTQRELYPSSEGADRPFVVGGAEYLVENGKGAHLVVRGLTWSRRLRLALGL